MIGTNSERVATLCELEIEKHIWNTASFRPSANEEEQNADGKA